MRTTNWSVHVVVGALVALLAFTASCVTVPRSENQPDASSQASVSGTWIAIINGVQVRAHQVVFKGSTYLSWRGFDLPATQALVHTSQRKQIYSDTVGLRQSFAWVDTEVQLTFTPDMDGRVCESFLSATKGFWGSVDDAYIRSFQSLPRPLHVIGNERSVVMYESARNDMPGSTWYFWFAGQVVAVELSDGGESGTLYSFIQSSLRFANASEWLMVRPEDFLTPDQILALAPEQICGQARVSSDSEQ